MNACIGIDFGGVIVKSRKSSTDDTGLREADQAEVAQAGVFEAIRQLVAFSAGKVWIVSKARPRMQSRTRQWLGDVDFFQRTGFDRDHVVFCLERQEKEPICRELGLTHFIDDRVHIMQILRYSVPNLYMFGECGEQKHCPPWATFVSDWSYVPRLIERSCENDACEQ